MEFSIEHELPGRLRLRCPKGAFTREEGCVIAALLETQPGVTVAVASYRTGSLLIRYEENVYKENIRELILSAARLIDKKFYGEIDGRALIPHESGLAGSVVSLLSGVVGRAFLPRLLRYGFTFFRSLPFLGRGIVSLWHRKGLNVSVLDASAVGVSLLRHDFRTATVITTLLALGDLLESWTHKKSRESLTDSLALNIDKLWVRREGQESQIPMGELQIGDWVVIRAGSVIPVDGVVCEGDAMVNQAAMTGESEPVHRVPGLSVYAGTVVEEGELVVRVTAFDSETRLRKIAEMIAASEELKADIQNRAEKMADAIVPYSFLLAGGIYLWTKDAVRATSALLVDYSCAIKLSTPLSILSAMREGAKRGMLVKGGKFLEALAAAEVVVFDKTGTLTVSSPSVAEVLPFEGYSREMVLRTAACLEEHFPHSIAQAVVKQAEKEKLSHREEHSTVEYAVAHGIASRIQGEKVLIGSSHFIFEDEAVICTPEQKELIGRKSDKYSLLYLAVGGKLAGVLCIEDPLREDARQIVKQLHEVGIVRVVMLTGDNRQVAENVAEMIGIDEVHAQLLPADKTKAINQLKKLGKVVMVGDGINDSPALAAADVGIAMCSGADIAQEVADVVLSENRLQGIVDVRKLSTRAMSKIYRNYAFIVGVNSLLLALGLGGAITPAVSALLHNLATIASSVYSLTPVLKKTLEIEREEEREVAVEAVEAMIESVVES
ncbi:MAG: heavy metal translocating P-type ATPase [Synergistaceae bacterium]|jgi:Cu2+-exporting ATPase|nr:heavy metal translocating P-type ATPase [Synergistaceae bacterium]